MNAIRDYYRRHVYLANLIDETHYLLIRMEPHEDAKVRPLRVKHLNKLLRYKRRAKGGSLSHN
ncbi:MULTISPECIES: hypothetical protein [Pseudomonas]|uniref:Uncharacterized protein n=1 Tax=Pseudomonas putida TaxID=303 RepID=A0A1B2F1C8_PSEPU|nr:MULTISPECIES: hypothetical protein [Pseudomonas]ANY85973.1 hypothetical protein IEC33019_0369 [Pseudomonas putida]